MSTDEKSRKTAIYWVLAIMFFLVGLDFYFHEIKFADLSFVHKISGFYLKTFSGNTRYGIRALFVIYFFIVSYSELNVKIRFRAEESFSFKVFLGVTAGLFSALFILQPINNWLAYLVWFVGAVLFIPQLRTVIKKNFDIKNNNDLSAERSAVNDDNSFVYETPDGRYVNVRNPFQGVLVSGGAGSGKSASFAEPTIHQMSKKNFTGILYDFKNFELTKILAKSYKLNKCPVRLFIVNFTEMDKTHRVNPIHPNNIPHIAYVNEYVNALVNNINKTWISKEGDFWTDSAKAILTATIWFFKRNHPEKCTLPHVVNTILEFSPEVLVTMLSTDITTKGMVASLANAVANKSADQVSGVIATIQNAIQKINTFQACWVLSGNDFSLDLNNPDDPKMVCLNNFPPTIDSISPLISLIITVSMKIMNVAGKEKSIVLLDEAPTLYIPKLDQIPATARSNRVSVFYMQQDFSQMEQTYGRVPMEAIIGNLGNQFLGKASGKKTLDYISNLVGKEEKYVRNFSAGESLSDSSNSASQNQSYSNQERLVLKPQDVMGFKPGEFICSVTKGEKPFCRTSLKMLQDYKGYDGGDDVHMEINSFAHNGFNEDGTPKFVSDQTAVENFENIISEVHDLMEHYRKLMDGQNQLEEKPLLETDNNGFAEEEGFSEFSENLLD